MQRHLVLVKLTQNGTNVQMNLTWVRNEQRFADDVLRLVDALIFESKTHLEVVKRISQLLCLAEKTGKVVVCDRFHASIIF